MTTRPMKLALAAAAAAVISVPAHAEMEKTKIAMPTLSLSQSANLIAQDMGFWKKAGVDVDLKLVRGMGATNAVLAGSVDFSNGSGPTVIRGVSHGRKLTAIMTTMIRPTYEVVLRKDIADKLKVKRSASFEERAKSLKGMTIALSGLNNITHVFLSYALAKAGLDPKRDVKITTMRPPAMIAALKKGDIDAFETGLPWTRIPETAGTGEVWVSNLAGDMPELSYFTNTVVITRVGFCEKKPSICQKVVKGYQMAIDQIRNKPEESMAVLRKHFPKMNAKLFKVAYEESVVKAISRTRGQFPPGGLKGAQDFMLKAGHMKKSDMIKDFGPLSTDKYVNITN